MTSTGSARFSSTSSGIQYSPSHSTIHVSKVPVALIKKLLRAQLETQGFQDSAHDDQIEAVDPAELQANFNIDLEQGEVVDLERSEPAVIAKAALLYLASLRSVSDLGKNGTLALDPQELRDKTTELHDRSGIPEETRKELQHFWELASTGDHMECFHRQASTSSAFATQSTVAQRQSVSTDRDGQTSNTTLATSLEKEERSMFETSPDKNRVSELFASLSNDDEQKGRTAKDESSSNPSQE